MSDRVTALTVVLAKPIREDEEFLTSLEQVIRAIPLVADVERNSTDLTGEHFGALQERHRLRMAIFNLLQEDQS